MFDFFNGSYVVPKGTYAPIIIKSDKIIHIHIKHVHVEFQRGNESLKPIICGKHIFIRGPILDLGAIMGQL